MKGILKFLDNNLGYFLIIPALILIILFSILPIFESLKFSFFDFQLNDQQKSGLYFSERYNLDLMHETFDYIDYYLDIEKDSLADANNKAELQTVRESINNEYENILQLFSEESGVVKITKNQKEELLISTQKSLDKLNSFYNKDLDFTMKDDTLTVASELNTCFIKPNFSGVNNFLAVLKDTRVWHSLYITIFFTVTSVGFELVLGLMLALIMNKAIAGRGFIRTFSLVPWAIPTSVAALMWAYLYNGSSGIIAIVFEKMGILAQSTDLMLTSSGALWAIILADVWKTTPYMALLLLAGLQVIPKSLYESSAIDGANKWQQFKNITLPLLKPAILVALLFRTLDAFRVFDLIYVLTGGGPGGTTESISIYAYKTMFAQTRFGYGSAMVLIMAIVVGIISYLYIKWLDVELISD
ncbi:MAG: sugar ABC transporter permease [Firmicutes bacterium]|nr:sugar ABC transporter permease [Bacillota bacterium]